MNTCKKYSYVHKCLTRRHTVRYTGGGYKPTAQRTRGREPPTRALKSRWHNVTGLHSEAGWRPHPGRRAGWEEVRTSGASALSLSAISGPTPTAYSRWLTNASDELQTRAGRKRRTTNETTRRTKRSDERSEATNEAKRRTKRRRRWFDDVSTIMTTLT
mgnify:CR=1 FL=1